MREKIIAISTILLVLIVASMYYRHISEQPANYVVFGSHENMNNELREALIARLKSNKIPYVIDVEGNVKIPDKKINKAAMCCT